MKFSRTAAHLAVAGTAALTMVGMSTATASAGTPASIRISGGGVYWYDGSDTLSVSDYKADGYAIEGTLTLNSGKTYTLSARGGKNDHTEKHINIAEGRDITLQLCYWNAVDNECTATAHGKA
ncbi:hypothetical protein [Streptomyces sclerotialus]|uniref:hypothetical protein n=1 Tax=Streptomyces sclerotialus TaxID=1957 RepID=UPI0004CB32AE